MKRIGRIVALVGAPILLAGILLSGSASFRSASGSTSTLNALSDKIDFVGILIMGGSHFTINAGRTPSTSCILHDGGTGPAIPCTLGGAGHADSATTNSGDFTIKGPDGTISFHDSAANGCATGFGIELDPAVPVAVRIEGVSTAAPITGFPNMFKIVGTLSVYEQGGPPAGIGCIPD